MKSKALSVLTVLVCTAIVASANLRNPAESPATTERIMDDPAPTDTSKWDDPVLRATYAAELAAESDSGYPPYPIPADWPEQPPPEPTWTPHATRLALSAAGIAATHVAAVHRLRLAWCGGSCEETPAPMVVLFACDTEPQGEGAAPAVAMVLEDPGADVSSGRFRRVVVGREAFTPIFADRPFASQSDGLASLPCLP